jgi:hypothetical protein
MVVNFLTSAPRCITYINLQHLPRRQIYKQPYYQLLPKMASSSAYPPGTFFDTIKKSFVDVPVDKGNDNAISTTEFLEAAESLTTLFGKGAQTDERLNEFIELIP